MSEVASLVKEALTRTKRLHSQISQTTQDGGDNDDTSKRLKSEIAETNKILVKIRRQLAADAVVEKTNDLILKKAIKEELVDRDANAARIAERQRVFSEKNVGGAEILARAKDSVLQVHASLSAICPNSTSLSASTPLLAAATHAAAAVAKPTTKPTTTATVTK